MADRPNYAEAERIANLFAMPRGLGGIVLTVRTFGAIPPGKPLLTLECPPDILMNRSRPFTRPRAATPSEQFRLAKMSEL